MDIKDRIWGAFTGLYFGSGVNPRFSPMLTPKEALKRFGKKNFGDYYDFKIYGIKNQVFDQHTTTKMVLDILFKYGKITPEISKDYLMKLHKKYDVFKGDIYGPSTQKSIKKILSGECLYDIGKTGTTCGSAMKSLPIAMFFYNDLNSMIKNTVNNCIISHNTDVAIEAAIVTNVTLMNLIRGINKFESIKKAISLSVKYRGKFGAKTKDPKIYEKIEEALKLLKGKSLEESAKIIPKKIGVNWYAREAIPGAFANYIVSKSPEESSLLSMRCGGDNQTVPEIACAFHGAEKGPEIFPKNILKNIEKVNKIKINKMAERLIKKIFDN